MEKNSTKFILISSPAQSTEKIIIKYSSYVHQCDCTLSKVSTNNLQCAWWYSDCCCNREIKSAHLMTIIKWITTSTNQHFTYKGILDIKLVRCCCCSWHRIDNNFAKFRVWWFEHIFRMLGVFPHCSEFDAICMVHAGSLNALPIKWH